MDFFIVGSDSSCRQKAMTMDQTNNSCRIMVGGWDTSILVLSLLIKNANV